MTLKIGGFYRTRHGLYLVRIEMFIDYSFDLDYHGHVVSPFNSGPNAIYWTKYGKYHQTKDHAFDLVEEVTDPVILAFYQK